MSQIKNKFITNGTIDLSQKVTGSLPAANGGTGTASTSQNFVFAGPTSGSGAPTFRALVAADVPTLNQNTTGTAANITATSNSTLTTLSALSLPGAQVTGNISGNAANITATSNSTLTTLSALSLPGAQVTGNISGNAANVTGTVAIANGGTGAATTSQNFAFIGPTSGSGAPSFRALVAGDIPSLSATYLALTGGTMSGAINMSSSKITNLANGTASGDAVNYSQLTALSTGLVWQSSINDPDLVDDSLSTPPGSPVYSLTYIIAASPTGAWASLAGHAVWWDGAQWIDLSTGNQATSGQGTAVQVGDRFAVAIASTGGPAHIGGGLTGLHNYIVQVTGNTPGSFTYSTTAPVNNYATSVTDSGSQHYGSSFTYVSSSTSWVDFSGPAKIVAGNALAYTGNTLNVLYDNSTIGLSSNQLLVKTGGITNTQINSAAAIARSKIASGTNYTFVTNDSSGVMQDTAVTASRALVTDANGLPAASATTSTELGYVSGVTSAIQTQINGLATTTLNNLGTTAINANLLPATTNTLNVGTLASRFAQGNFSAVGAVDGTSGILLQSNGLGSYPNTGMYALQLIASATQNMAMQTPNNATANSTATSSIFISTGNKTAGTGNSGDLSLTIGTSSGGTRGKVRIKDGSEGTIGYVWTSTDTNGSGQWQATASTITPNKETFVLSGADITNQYIDLGHVAKTNSIIFMAQGAGYLLEDTSPTQYIFTVTSANATSGATYTNNGHTFTVVTTIAGATTLTTTGTGAPTASGTLTKATGTGDATITFSAFRQYDYSVSYTGGSGGNTRITFLGDLATGGSAALVAGDSIQVNYAY